MIDNSHFFENTHNATVRPNHGTTTDPHTNQNNQLSGKLLLVLKLKNDIIFVYETYNIILTNNQVKDIIPKEYRTERSNTEIIDNHIESYNDTASKFEQVELIACNPAEYPVRKLVRKTI